MNEDLLPGMVPPAQLELDLTWSGRPTPDDAAQAVRGLLHEAMVYASGKDVIALLLRIGRSFRLSPFNALLLDAQAPGSTYVATASRWRVHWGRRVRVGQRPRLILIPFGPVSLVYDVSQVEPIDDTSPELPTEITDPFGIPPIRDAEAALESIERLARFEGIRITTTVEGSQSAGSVRRVRDGSTMTVHPSTRSGPLEIPVDADIHVSRELDAAARFVTLAHELGHVFCGHVDLGDTSRWPDRSHLGTQVEETEAESVALMVALRLDPTTKPTSYLAEYLDAGAPVPPIDIGVATTAAGRVLDLVDAPQKVLKRFSERQKRAAARAGRARGRSGTARRAGGRPATMRSEGGPRPGQDPLGLGEERLIDHPTLEREDPLLGTGGGE